MALERFTVWHCNRRHNEILHGHGGAAPGAAPEGPRYKLEELSRWTDEGQAALRPLPKPTRDIYQRARRIVFIATVSNDHVGWTSIADAPVIIEASDDIV